MDEVLHDGPDYVARAGSLGPALAAAADEIERNRELPASIVSALIENGLFRLLQPRSLGGAELDPMTYVKVVEQIASHDASTGWYVEHANGCSMAAAFLDPEVAQEIFGPPETASRLGPGRPGRAARTPRRVPSDRRLEFRQRQPSRELAWRPCRDARPPRRAAHPRGWRGLVGGGAAEGRATHSLILAWREAHAKLGRYLELGERLSIGFHCYIAESREQGIREAAKFYEENELRVFASLADAKALLD